MLSECWRRGNKTGNDSGRVAYEIGSLTLSLSLSLSLFSNQAAYLANTFQDACTHCLRSVESAQVIHHPCFAGCCDAQLLQSIPTTDDIAKQNKCLNFIYRSLQNNVQKSPKSWKVKSDISHKTRQGGFRTGRAQWSQKGRGSAQGIVKEINRRNSRRVCSIWHTFSNGSRALLEELCRATISVCQEHEGCFRCDYTRLKTYGWISAAVGKDNRSFIQLVAVCPWPQGMLYPILCTRHVSIRRRKYRISSNMWLTSCYVCTIQSYQKSRIYFCASPLPLVLLPAVASFLSFSISSLFSELIENFGVHGKVDYVALLCLGDSDRGVTQHWAEGWTRQRFETWWTYCQSFLSKMWTWYIMDLDLPVALNL